MMGLGISIQSVRTAFANGATSAPRIYTRYCHIQEISPTNHSVQDLKIKINIPQNTENVSGAKLEEFSKLLQINDLDNSKAEVLSTESANT